MSNETNNDLRIKRLEQHIRALEERMAFLEGKDKPDTASPAKKIRDLKNKTS